MSGRSNLDGSSTLNADSDPHLCRVAFHYTKLRFIN